MVPSEIEIVDPTVTLRENEILWQTQAEHQQREAALLP
jgi:hypothetical protein